MNEARWSNEGQEGHVKTFTISTGNTDTVSHYVYHFCEQNTSENNLRDGGFILPVASVSKHS